MKISSPRGTSDILPDQIAAWQTLELKARTLLRTYGYREIRTPAFEDAGLFRRSLGETTEVVNKQLLEVKSQRETADEDDAGGFALRPEGTAPVVRAFNQHDLGREEFLSKLFYMGPMFRGERPQKGRLRQFHQIGAEAIGRGGDHPLLDAEMIALAVDLLKSFGVSDFKVRINSLGTAQDKQNFAEWLRLRLKDGVAGLTPECQGQFERNVFRLLDSKDPACRALVAGLKIGTEHLSAGGLDYFEKVKAGLDRLGISYEISSHLVRGLDYYTHTVFEISYAGLGAQDALGAGGRYNGLVEKLGGGDRRFPDPVGAIGFALGMERILLALEAQGKASAVPRSLDVFVVAGGSECVDEVFLLVQELRQAGISADMDFGKDRQVRKQFEQADRQGARFTLVLGRQEMSEGKVTLKDMVSGEQSALARNAITATLKSML